VQDLNDLAFTLSGRVISAADVRQVLAPVFEERDAALVWVKVLEGTPFEKERAALVDFLKTNFPELCNTDTWPSERAIFVLRRLKARVAELEQSTYADLRVRLADLLAENAQLKAQAIEREREIGPLCDKLTAETARADLVQGHLDHKLEMERERMVVYNQQVAEIAKLTARADKAEAIISKTYQQTCIHHNDKEREESGCPVCQKARAEKATAACARKNDRLREILQVAWMIDDDDQHQTKAINAALDDNIGTGYVLAERFRPVVEALTQAVAYPGGLERECKVKEAATKALALCRELLPDAKT
jgi:hypothetical protein